jgi:hypothetical protein
MKKHLTTFCGIVAFLLGGHVAMAQENPHVNFRVEARGDLQYENIAGNTIDGNTGFRGKQLNLRLNGNINDSWSYTYRQRMGRPNADESYFNAVDHLNLTYATGAWAFTGGKQTVAVGGYEYDRAPIDFYFGSEFWYNMACYQWGVSAKYNLGTESNDALTLQVTQSPFRSAVNPNMYSYNLLWTGSYGWLDVLHSVNMLEYLPGKFVNFIALGHQFHMGDFMLQLDWMNRADVEHFGFDDFSLMADLSWSASEKLNVFGKASYDVNKDNLVDSCVLPGTELTRLGAGVEYFPIKDSRDVRLHAGYSYAWGKNGNPGGTVGDNHSFVSVGVTWRMSILKR